MGNLEEHMEGYNLEEMRASRQRWKDSKKDNTVEDAIAPIYTPAQPVTYERYKLKLALTLRRRIGESIRYTDKEVILIAKLIRWVINDATGPLDPSKGVMIFGHFGTGKTSLVDAIHEINTRYFAVPNLDLYRCVRYKAALKKALRENSVHDMYDRKSRYLYIDDLGFLDEDKVNSYGNHVNVVADTITDRYEKWKYSGWKTLITTNMIPQHIVDTYGRGIYGRLKEMCHLLEWDETDHRMNKKQ